MPKQKKDKSLLNITRNQPYRREYHLRNRTTPILPTVGNFADPESPPTFRGFETPTETPTTTESRRAVLEYLESDLIESIVTPIDLAQYIPQTDPL